MTIKEALKEATIKLSKKDIPSARLDAEILLMYALGKTKEWMYTRINDQVPRNSFNKYQKLIAREKREPVAYITNHKEFFGFNFYVDKNVLIPRPETEKLVELALQIINKKQEANNKKLVIAEIGTGSGCIAISLAKELLELETRNSKLNIVATDISEKALIVARKNAKAHKVYKNIKFIKTNLLDKIKYQFDFIISNPPYVPKNSKLEKELSFEPKIALFPKKDFLSKFLKTCISHLKDNGFLFLEIDPNWKTKIEKLKKNKEIKSVTFYKDLRGNYRYAVIKKGLL